MGKRFFGILLSLAMILALLPAVAAAEGEPDRLFLDMPVAHFFFDNSAESAQTVTIKNNGDKALTLTQPTAENYIVGTLSKTELASEESATFTLKPKSGAVANEAITINGTIAEYDNYAVSTAIYAQRSDTSWYTDNRGDMEYTLTTAAQLAGLTRLCREDITASPFSGKTVRLGTDIDLDAYEWQPIWWNAGTFDGQGHAITNMRVNCGLYNYDSNGSDVDDENHLYGGLFGYTGDEATLSSFTVAGSITLLNGYGFMFNKITYAGGAVGFNNKGTLINLGSAVDVNVENNTRNGLKLSCTYAGGIAGYTYTNSPNDCILNSYADGDISALASGEACAGGIAGFSLSDPILNCYYRGSSITANATANSNFAKAACIATVYKRLDKHVFNCYSNISGMSDTAADLDTRSENGDPYDGIDDLLEKLNDSAVRERIIADHGVTPAMWSLGEGGKPTLFAPPIPAGEQFGLATGETYWFDLSNEGIQGTVNPALPDTALHYLPFTYAGTVNAYSRTDNGESTVLNVTVSPRSLFVSDYNLTHTVSWDELNDARLIFGAPYSSGGVGYTLRSPSAGSSKNGVDGDAQRGIPETNEWDMVLDKGISIAGWQNIFSWGQDAANSLDDSVKAIRGSRSSRYHSRASSAYNTSDQLGFRPVLEVLNPATLGQNGLKAVTLYLNGGTLTTGNGYNGAAITEMKTVYTGESFIAPLADRFTRPEGNTGEYFAWRGSNGNIYAPGAPVPAAVTALNAIYEPVPITDYVVTFANGGGTGVDPAQANTAEGGTFTLPANPYTKAGCRFAGWNDGESTYAAGANYTMPAHAVTFTAVWQTGGGQGGNDGVYSIDADALFYDADYDMMTTLPTMTYGDPVYLQLLMPDGSPVIEHAMVDGMKLRINLEQGGDLIDGEPEIVKLNVNGEYQYFIKLATKKKLTTADSDVVGTITLNKSKKNKKDAGNYKVKDLKVDIDFTLGYYYNAADNTFEAIIDEPSFPIWPNEFFLCKYDSSADSDVEFEFGSEPNEGTFTVDTSGQGKNLITFNTDIDENIAAKNPEAAIITLNFNGAKFNRSGVFNYESDTMKYAYEIKNGKLVLIGEFSDGEVEFKTNTLGRYVFSDRELTSPERIDEIDFEREFAALID